MTREVEARQASKYLIELLKSDWKKLYQPKRLWPQEAKWIRQLVVDDLMGRSSVLPPSEQHDIWENANSALAETTRSTAKAGPIAHRERRRADIVILTVLRVERDAVLAAFGEDPNRTEDFERDGVFFYRIAIESARYSQKFVVWVTMVGEPRNVPCALFVDRIRSHLDTRAVVLLGIAGGNKDKVNIGDVVASYEILDDDGGVDNYLSTVNLLKFSFDIRKRQSRVRIIDHYGRLKRLLTNFSVDAPDWKNRRSAVIGFGDRGALKFSVSDLESPVDYKLGLIQAGDRLRKDGSLPGTSAKYHDKLFAVEMEGSGFGQSCRDKGYDWIVVRGISDLGDKKKRDKQQSLAATSAATLLVQFLTTTFSPSRENGEIEF